MHKIINAIQKIYPTIQGGYMYWHTQMNGEPHNDPMDGLIWENTKFPKPTWKQIEAQFPTIDLEDAKEIRLATRNALLAESDWQVAAFIKYGRPVDKEVVDKSKLIAAQKKDIKACKTLDDLKKYLINFNN